MFIYQLQNKLYLYCLYLCSLSTNTISIIVISLYNSFKNIIIIIIIGTNRGKGKAEGIL